MNNIGNTSPRHSSSPRISSPRPVTIKSVKEKNIVEDTTDLVALSDSDSDSEESSRGIKRKWDGQEIGEPSVPSTEINLTQLLSKEENTRLSSKRFLSHRASRTQTLSPALNDAGTSSDTAPIPVLNTEAILHDTEKNSTEAMQTILHGEASQSLDYKNLLYNNRLSKTALTNFKKELLEIKEKVSQDASKLSIPIHGYEIKLPIIDLLEVRYELSQFKIKLKSACDNNNLSEERKLLFNRYCETIKNNIIFLSGNINELAKTHKEYKNNNLSPEKVSEIPKIKSQLEDDIKKQLESVKNMQNIIEQSDIEALYVNLTQDNEKFKETDIENLEKFVSLQEKVIDNNFTDEGLEAILEALDAQTKEQKIFDAIPKRILEIKNNDEDDITTKIQRMESLALYRNALRERIPEYIRYIEELLELHKEFKKL